MSQQLQGVGFETETLNTPPWDIVIDNGSTEKVFSTYRYIEFEEVVNDVASLDAKVVGDISDHDDSGNDVKLRYKEEVKWVGELRDVGSSSDGVTDIEATGYEYKLERDNASELFVDGTVADSNRDTDDIVSTLVDGRMGVNAEVLNTDPVDFQVDNDTALEAVTRLAEDFGADWFVTLDSNNTPVFNWVNPGLTTDTKASYELSGTKQNVRAAEKVERNKELYDGVVVKGKGDGEDQITSRYPDQNFGPSDEVLQKTDKTIISQSQADNRAESLYNKHSTSWNEIHVYPAETNELREIEDKVNIVDPGAGLNGDFRVIGRRLIVDPFSEKLGSQAPQVLQEVMCSNKPLSFVRDVVRNKRTTKSQTDYGQGSRNVWGEKETANSSSTTPLKMRVYIPEDVIDAAGNNRTKSIRLNYSASAYRKDGESVTAEVESLPTSSEEDKNTAVRMPILEQEEATSTESGGSSPVVGGGKSFTDKVISDSQWSKIGDFDISNIGETDQNGDYIVPPNDDIVVHISGISFEDPKTSLMDFRVGLD